MDVDQTQIRRILKSLAKMDDKKIDEWMQKPLPGFNLKTPLQILDENKGAQLIAFLTKALPNGVPNKIDPKKPNELRRKDVKPEKKE